MNTPSTVKSNRVTFLILFSPFQKNELLGNFQPGMISPASGIHRPSYNGAPAIQTFDYIWLFMTFAFRKMFAL